MEDYMKSERNMIIVLRAITMVLFLCPAVVHGEPEAREIMNMAFEAMKLGGAESVATMIIMDNKGRERIREIAQASKFYKENNTEKKIIRFLSPADVKGTGLLIFDYKDKEDNIWLYMPALRKTRRIVSSERAKSFMGSEFSYADMTPPVLDDFTYSILGEETIDNAECWIIEMIPKNEDLIYDNGFSKKISWIGKADYVVRKSDYYDPDGELEKQLDVLEVKNLDPENNKYRPTHMIIHNVQNGRKSIIKIKEIVFNPDVKDEYFTTRYLELK
jgi:outer membrane lipoprotein-sorting protein